ncbi:Six-hairpin glycosidase [Meredithblackwellia eburnea MCA 4105]
MPPIRQDLLATAESLKPTLKQLATEPRSVIEVHEDPHSLLGWKATETGQLKDISILNPGDSCIIDFGGHRTGFFSFDVVEVLTGITPADAPARLRLVFGEVLNDVAEPFEPYKGFLSASWLPEEIINVDFLPQHVDMPRRYAFRYVKITVISTSMRFGVRFENCVATKVTSAPLENPTPLSFKFGPPVSTEDQKLLQRIDTVAMETLRNCMQTVYEDGPRRDMRLWIGDLRLQALASYCTFKDYNLVKRCLYLFAALPHDDEGMLGACVYEKPRPHFGGTSIVDYALLFSPTLLEYVNASGDKETGRELFEIALKQFEIHFRKVSTDFLYVIPTSAPSFGGTDWHFIDWQEKLERTTSIQAVFIFCMRSLCDLASSLDLAPPQISTPQLATSTTCLEDLVVKMMNSSRKNHYDSEKGVFVSGEERQVSWASQVWAVIAGIPESKEQGAKALRLAYEDPEAVKGTTPYLHHYLCEAFILAGLDDLALSHIKLYWGSMIEAGAETFFEAWDPERPRFSPYGDLHVNSFCHAWSCTPSLLLRQMGFE